MTRTTNAQVHASVNALNATHDLPNAEGVHFVVYSAYGATGLALDGGKRGFRSLIGLTSKRDLLDEIRRTDFTRSVAWHSRPEGAVDVAA